jgi:serine/threonine-protein phosphatase 2A regulatory subunit A
MTAAEGKEDGGSGGGGDLGGAGAAAAGPAAGAHVEVGDTSAASVPPAVPIPVFVSCSSQEAGAAAAAQLLPLLAGFAQDDQDGVRLLAVDGCVALARLVNGGMTSGAALAVGGSAAAAAAAERQGDAAARLRRFGDEREQVLGVVAALAKDHAWRVRWSVANRLSELADAFGPALTAERLLPRFQGLLLDGEAEVRTAAAYRVRDLGVMVGREALLEAVLPCVGRLAEDASDAVRAALSSVVLGLAPVLGAAATIESLLPLFLRLLKDPSAQVRLNVIAHLEAVNSVLGLATLAQSLLPAIQELSADRSWRVRQAIIDFMPQLARQLGPAVFEAQPELADLCLSWLADPVFAVREAAAGNLRRLAEVFGAAWADAVLVPRLLALRPEDSRTAFQQRMTALAAMVTLGEAVGAPVLTARLLPAIALLARDAVPNVRFSVARSLQRLVASTLRAEPHAVRDVVRPCLEALAGDADADVRFFAQRALNSL